MNIALTYACNQKCPYCFAADAMSISGRSEISIRNLKIVTDFLKKSKITEFRMAGGEPTLHSRFREIYDLVSANSFNITILSNGIIDEGNVNFLAKKNNLDGILLNINQPKSYTLKAWKKIENTLFRLNKKITLGFRIYEFDFNPRFFFDLIDKYNLNRFINWAIACPGLVKDNIYIKLEDHKKVIDRMVEFTYESKKRDIRWYSDSGFILCAFNKEKLEKLEKNTGFLPTTNCMVGIEIAPDLRVFRCFGLAAKSNKNLKLTDFKNFQAVEEYFTINSLPFKRIGTFDRCFKCEHLISRRCGGGCMAHILKRFPDHKEPIF